MRLTILAFIATIILNSCSYRNVNKTTMNKLNKSSSPYLQQHADNPVHWQEWGPEALKLAKELNKPLIISIGYAACHWCHVMEHESFSDEEVAEFMNHNFVCIKVDREERPDIDQIYMDAVHLIKGQGGWPLNAFAMPDGRPFYAGTYFPKQKWLSTMKQIIDLYNNEFDEVKEYADDLTHGISKSLVSEIDTSSSINFSEDDYLGIHEQWLKNIDKVDGGFKRAPKFPMPVNWEFLLEYYYRTKNQEVIDVVTLTLDKMASGGIYDQIGGGFARYSVDGYWKVPHFEKMLYDNGQLVSLYSHAYQLTGNDRYKEIIEQTLEFVKQELTDVKGGFYSSLNADSEGVEGKFYVWSYDEIQQVIGNENLELVTSYFKSTKEGNWENGTNILMALSDIEKFANKNDLSKEKLKTIIQEANKKLSAQRNTRIRPSTDDKILTSWNALMISGYIDAYNALGNNEYYETALVAAEFMRDNMIKKDGSLYRSYMNGKSGIDAFLDDYALLSDAYMKLYSITFDIQWLDISKDLIDYCLDHFHDESTGMFFYTSDEGEKLIARKHEISDNVIPSSNSIMAKVLFKAGHMLTHQEYIKISETMLKQQAVKIKNSGIWYANWASLAGMMVCGINEIVITGNDCVSNSHEIQKQYLPFSVIVGGKQENLPLMENRLIADKNLFYVCRNKVCDLPTDNVIDAVKQISVQ